MSEKSTQAITENENIATVPAAVSGLSEELEKLATNEERISYCLEKMKWSLSQDKTPNFRLFWETRKLCLPLFKEFLNHTMRLKFWAEYINLSEEAKRLKIILEEQSSFAAEQIDLAIHGVDEDLQKYDSLLKEMPDVALPQNCHTLQEVKEHLEKVQKEVNLLTIFSHRISSLRKEILKTAMKIKIKSRFFEKLTALADGVEPKRKGYVKEVSDGFVSCVNSFTNDGNFDITKAPFYVLKDEVKNLQSAAKVLSLNSQVFKMVRQSLSKCWDVIRAAEIDYKKDSEDKIKELEENRSQVEAKIAEIEKIANEEELDKACGELLQYMRTIKLQSADVKRLKPKIFALKSAKQEKEIRKKDEKIRQERESDMLKFKNLELLREKAQAVFNNEKLSIDELEQNKAEIEKELETLRLNRSEKFMIQKDIRRLQNRITDQKEQIAMQNAPDELIHLQELYDTKKKRRLEIKTQLDNYRREADKSGFDFEKAMHYRQLIDEERERLELLDQSLAEIEEKIGELENS